MSDIIMSPRSASAAMRSGRAWRQRPLTALVSEIVAVNAVWAVGSVVVAAAWGSPTTAGTARIATHGVAVGALGLVQAVAMRRSGSVARWRTRRDTTARPASGTSLVLARTASAASPGSARSWPPCRSPDSPASSCWTPAAASVTARLAWDRSR